MKTGSRVVTRHTCSVFEDEQSASSIVSGTSEVDLVIDFSIDELQRSGSDMREEIVLNFLPEGQHRREDIFSGGEKAMAILQTFLRSVESGVH